MKLSIVTLLLLVFFSTEYQKRLDVMSKTFDGISKRLDVISKRLDVISFCL